MVLKSEYLNFMVAKRMYEYIKGYSEIPDTMKHFEELYLNFMTDEIFGWSGEKERIVVLHSEFWI